MGFLSWREAEISPALVKVFDEILVNAADNRARDASTSRIDVTIDADEGVIEAIADPCKPRELVLLSRSPSSCPSSCASSRFLSNDSCTAGVQQRARHSRGRA